MSVPTQLSLYNKALTLVGEQRIASLTVSRPERRALDVIWDDDPIKQMLEEAQWTWATRTLEWNYDSSVTSDFGYRYAFTKPPNYIRTVAVCSDEFFKAPLIEHSDENNYWFCDLETIYIKYVSDDVLFGRDYSLWTALFRNCVTSKMAKELAISLTKSKTIKDDMKAELKAYIKDAKSLDAMSKPTSFKPMGSWVRSRLSGGVSSRSTRSGGR